ncbi:hypothetical protein [Lysinibacillus sp. NPDC093688]
MSVISVMPQDVVFYRCMSVSRYKIARGLYEKMGYEITNITMAKTI